MAALAFTKIESEKKLKVKLLGHSLRSRKPRAKNGCEQSECS